MSENYQGRDGGGGKEQNLTSSARAGELHLQPYE
jgi:hypothetical protein